MSVVDYAVDGQVAKVTLNRPAVLNASNLAMKVELQDAFAKAGSDDDVRVIVLTGAGRGFCTGGDIKESASFSRDAYRTAVQEHHRVCIAIWRSPKPVIAAINGYALGGGLEMAMACDLRIAADSAQFGIPVLKSGGVTTGALYQLLIGAIGLGRMAHLALMGEPINAQEAAHIGLVTRAVGDDVLQSVAHEAACKIASYPHAGVALYKRAVHFALDPAFEAALAEDEAIAFAAKGSA